MQNRCVCYIYGFCQGGFQISIAMSYMCRCRDLATAADLFEQYALKLSQVVFHYYKCSSLLE